MERSRSVLRTRRDRQRRDVPELVEREIRAKGFVAGRFRLEGVDATGRTDETRGEQREVAHVCPDVDAHVPLREQAHEHGRHDGLVPPGGQKLPARHVGGVQAHAEAPRHGHLEPGVHPRDEGDRHVSQDRRAQQLGGNRAQGDERRRSEPWPRSDPGSEPGEEPAFR